MIITILGISIVIAISIVLYLYVRQGIHSHKEIMTAIKSWDGKHDVIFEFTTYDNTYSVTIQLFNEWFVKHSFLYMYYTIMKFCLRKFV